MVDLRWTYINKSDETTYQAWRRVVAREYKLFNPYLEGTFLATPPLEALEFCLSRAKTTLRRKGKILKLRILILDVSRAHVHLPCKRELYIEPSEQDQITGEGTVGLLGKCYGTRDASAGWQEFSIEVFDKVGLDAGVSHPCLIAAKDPEDVTLGYEHVDDIVLTGEEEVLLEYEKKISEDMMIKRVAL